MKWISIPTKTRTAPEFIGCEPVIRASWFCLMLYCAEHETGGVILDCASWGDRRWMQTCGITKSEVMAESSLWSFVSGSLHLWGYPVECEQYVTERRNSGRLGGKRSVEVRRKKKEAQLEAQLKPNVEAQVQPKEKKGKVKNEEEERGSAPARNAPPLPVEQMEAMALTVGMPDFQCFVEYWATRNWVCDYGGVLHPMTKDEIGRAMANWKTMDAEIRKKYANAKRNQDRNRTSTASLPATYLKSPDGKYTPEKCGF